MPGLDWVFPIAGANEWSGGSWMPTTKTHRGRTHPGIDIYAEPGTAIVAPMAGTVMEAATGKVGGNYVRIRGDDGVVYYFAHMQSASMLRPGARIEKAATIGFVGNTGSARTTKPHLHFTMRVNDKPIDPRSYLNGAYKLDAPPGVSYDQSTGEETYVPYNPDQYGYSGARDIYDAVMGGDEGPVPMTSAEVVGSVLSSVSNMIAGGQRADYRGLGTTGVRQSDLPLLIKEQGMTAAVDEAPAADDGLTVKKVGQQNAVEEV